MDYLSLLTNDEVNDLCKVISGKIIKKFFTENPNEFARIKSGFRPSRISEDEAVSLVIQNINKTFLRRFINGQTESWLKQVKNNIDFFKIKGHVEEQAIAETLADSPFDSHIELYFKLIGRSVDKEYIDDIKERILALKNKKDETSSSDDTEKVSSEQKISELEQKVTELNLQLTKLVAISEHKENEYAEKKQALEENNSKLEKTLEELQQQFQDLQYEKKKADEELFELHIRAQYDDTEDAIAACAHTEDYQYVSLCEVVYSGYNNQKWLMRLADIKEGILETFNCQEDQPKYFGNRNRLFLKDGPTEVKTVGVWKWNAGPNNSDPSKDFVQISFNREIMPAEVITIPNCESSEQLLNSLKAGCTAEITAVRTIFAACLSKGQYIGFLCKKHDLEQDGSVVKLKKDVITIPFYNFEDKDVIQLSNGKVYFKRINIGMPVEVVKVKNSFEIVKSVIMSRNSWALFKQSGKTRSEWRIIKDFLENMDTTTIVEDIAQTAKCDIVDAEKFLDKFCEQAKEYIEGVTIEDSLVAAVVYANNEMMERCKKLVTEDWNREHQLEIEKAQKNLQELEQQIQSVKDKSAREQQDADNQLAKTKKQQDLLLTSLKKIEDDIAMKEKLADEVEKNVAEKIRQAQDNASQFIADFAFISQARATNSMDRVIERKTTNVFQIDYQSGKCLRLNEDWESSNWEELLETIAEALEDTGVNRRYSKPLAAYMYASFLADSPLMIIGPSASNIVDAFSGAMFGCTAGILECEESYNSEVVKKCYESGDRVVKIINPFNHNWIARIPDIVKHSDIFFIAVYPYSEDVQIEPKSMFNYMLPVFTEIFIDKEPIRDIQGGHLTNEYENFQLVEPLRLHTRILKNLHISLFTRNKIQMLLSNLHGMLKDESVDFDIVFLLLPYAYVTMQLPVLLDAIQSGGKKMLSVSNDLLNEIENLYGENNG